MLTMPAINCFLVFDERVHALMGFKMMLLSASDGKNISFPSLAKMANAESVLSNIESAAFNLTPPRRFLHKSFFTTDQV